MKVSVSTPRGRFKQVGCMCTVYLFMAIKASTADLHGHTKGKRSRRWQRKIWMDSVREYLKEKNIDLTRIGEA